MDPLDGSAWMVRQGDCLRVMAEFQDASVDLVYLDPPFNSGSERRGRTGLHFADRFDDIDHYRAFLAPRLLEARRLLRDTGSILVHVDWRTSHHVRMMLDEVFGGENFVNHLVWSYGLGGSGPRSFARKHDDIFFYGKTDSYWFEPPRVPARSARLRGRTKKATDVLDIASLNNMAIERTGWPTQKPLALLSMLVGACCVPEGVVLDPTCGSGTTLVAAVSSGRRAIGIDISDKALAIAQSRCASASEARAAMSATRQAARRPRQAQQGPGPLAQSA